MDTPTLSAHFFTWRGCNGSCEASELPGAIGDRFQVAGRTRTIEFSKVRENRDGEGELQSVDFASPDRVFVITVFND